MNCRGLADKHKRRDVFDYLKNKDFNIYCLQDIHIDKKLERYVTAEWGLDTIICGLNSMVVLFKSSGFEYKILKVRKDHENGNFIMVEIETPSFTFVLINLYGPNSDSPAFFKHIAENLEFFATDNYIWCGDWNLIMSPNNDSFNYKHINNPKARDVVIDLCDNLNLVDVWRVFHEGENKFTWFRKNPYPLMSRLDFFFGFR